MRPWHGGGQSFYLQCRGVLAKTRDVILANKNTLFYVEIMFLTLYNLLPQQGAIEKCYITVHTVFSLWGNPSLYNLLPQQGGLPSNSLHIYNDIKIIDMKVNISCTTGIAHSSIVPPLRWQDFCFQTCLYTCACIPCDVYTTAGITHPHCVT